MSDPAAAPATPSEIERLFERGRAAQLSGRLDEAMACYREALKRAPEHGGALNNLGVALKTLNRFAPAVACYKRALARTPDDIGLLSNLGNALRGLGRFDEAETVLKRALALLQAGDLERGFAEYEWRWRTREMPQRNFKEPAWDGAPLGGRTILLHAEQGFGDTLQFVRYAPLVAGRGGRVVLECQPGLERLMQSLDGVGEIIAKGAALPRFDVQAPLLSLPRLFGTTLATIPSPARYLAAPADRVAGFRSRLAAPPGVRRIGIAWAGKPSHKNDHNRSAGLRPFIDLLGIAGTRWYALQVGQRAADIAALDCAGLIDDLSPELDDFAATAAALECLDLVITVDTAVAHLAGALGRPVWLALAFGGEWRYPEGREDCPWYPSMRLFQQTRFGDWDGVFRRIGEALESRRA